jgi:hypothetical protein
MLIEVYYVNEKSNDIGGYVGRCIFRQTCFDIFVGKNELLPFYVPRYSDT